MIIQVDYIDSLVELLGVVAALSICLLNYITHKNKNVIYLIAVFLGGLMSGYYWTVYTLIVGDTPYVSDVFYYFGWNTGYLILFILIMSIKSPEERRYFNPLMLVPIPLNIWQLLLYLPWGGIVNCIYQVTVMSLIAIASIQGICFYFKNRESGKRKLYIFLSTLIFAALSFGMWTATCFDGVIYNMYYVLSFMNSVNYLILALVICRYSERKVSEEEKMEKRFTDILKGIYLVMIFICTGGGLLLGIWMKKTLEKGTSASSGNSIFDIISAVLFIISLFIAAFVIVIIFVVNLMEKNAENNALREARRVADRANEAKSEFLANMSHEIRTPINAIMGMNEMIIRESSKSGNREIYNYAGNVESAGRNLLSIINDILDFSKIEAGKLEIVSMNYRLSSVLNDVSNMISFRAKAKDLKFDVDVDGSIPDGLYGDEVRLRQIMTNLLNNAVKYTENGSINLYVRRDRKDAVAKGDTVNLIISVKDTGIGIRKEDMDRLFTKFERMDLQHNSSVEGTGLGLAITHNLLRLMGGSINVTSEYGRGSTFTATIPQRVVSTEPVGDFKKKFEDSFAANKDHNVSFHAPDAHILVVDDTKMNLVVAEGLLKLTGIRIDTASSGPESVRMARTIPYDVILMDQRMPDMDGTEALNLIRSEEGGANNATPVICLTADAVSGAREKYIAEGFDDYLTKPIEGDSLEKILIQYLPDGKVVFEGSDR